MFLYADESMRTDYEKACEHLWSTIIIYSHSRIFSHLPILKVLLRGVLETTEPPALSLDQFHHPPQSTAPRAFTAISDESPTGVPTKEISDMHLQLEKLYSLVKTLPAAPAPDHEDIRELLDLSHSLRYKQDLRSFVTTTPNHQKAETRRLIREIEFLGRIRAAYFTIISVIHTFPNFGRLKVIPDTPVTPPEKPSQPQQGRLSLEQTLGPLKLPLEASTVKKTIGQGFTVQRADLTFMKLQSVNLPTHAEIQMITLLMTKSFTLESVYPYIGCSKLICYLCFLFVQSCVQFQMRASHRRIFPKWCLPRITGLQESEVNLLRQGVKRLRDEITRQILTPIMKTSRIEATSTADVTSLCSAEDDRFRVESVARSLPTYRLAHTRALEHQRLRDMFGE